ncbi:MAG: hypothetical protein AMS22_14220 [Thiotrichales bacterium SG8_50]|nr:MAG: hypothetical protein AMS22_14220 [Thiotrichales bacterium SG8_50]
MYFPIVNGECSTFELPGATEADLRTCANDLADHIKNLEVTIDGKQVQMLNRYRVESPLYTIGPLPEGNVLGADAGTMYDSVGDGFFLMLAPLSRGEHEIHFKGEAEFTLEEDGFDFLFQLDITYNINVGK